jgi:ribulose-phosphate 3-epimerase
MKLLGEHARRCGLKALTLEPMSSSFEPPSTPEEIDWICGELARHHQANPGRSVPTYVCADISHGLCDEHRAVVVSNTELFTAGARWMAEFHFKNTEADYGATFGFSEAECARGIVELPRFRELCAATANAWPVQEMVGYLELPGPKLGRNYTDGKLGAALRSSLASLRAVFDPEKS